MKILAREANCTNYLEKVGDGFFNKQPGIVSLICDIISTKMRNSCNGQ